MTLPDSGIVQVWPCKTAHQVWKMINKIYGGNQVGHLITLIKHLVGTKFQDGDDPVEYVAKIDRLNQELSAQSTKVELSPLVVSVIALAGLPNEYEPLVMSMEGQIENLTLANIQSRLQDSCIRRNNSKVNEQAFVVQTGNSDQVTMRCDFCDRTGHRTKECYQMMEMKRKAKDRRTCYLCSKSGHIVSNCPLAKKLQQKSIEDNSAYSYTCSSLSENKSKNWILDSAASSHCTGNKNLLKNVRKQSGRHLIVANGGKCQVKGEGQVVLDHEFLGEGSEKALLVPDFPVNLLSVGKLADRGLVTVFSKSEVKVYGKKPHNQLVLCGKRGDDGLYYLDEEHTYKSTSDYESALAVAPSSGASELWHQRCGHFNYQALKKAARENAVIGLPSDVVAVGTPCEGCILGKMARKSFKRGALHRADAPMEIVYSDGCGPMEVNSVHGSKYFYTFIDDKTDYWWVKFAKKKSELEQLCKSFVEHVSNMTDAKLKILHSDNGGEYISTAFRNFLAANGIQQVTISPHNPEQDGRAERANRTIGGQARSMLQHAGLGKQFWEDAVRNAVRIRNVMPSNSLKGQVPHTLLKKEKPNISNFKVFGCDCFALIASEDRKKWDAKADRCINLGPSDDEMGYFVFRMRDRRILKRRDVTFMESSFRNARTLREDPSGESQIAERLTAEMYFPRLQITPPEDCAVDCVGSEQTSCESNETESSQSLNHGDVLEEEEELPLRRSARIRRNPERWWEACRDTSCDNGQMHEPEDESGCDEDVVSGKENLSEEDAALKVGGFEPLSIEEPENVSQALSGPQAEEWRNAMDAEIKSILDNHTYSLVSLPNGRKPIGCRFVFKVERKSDGSIDRFKARLVAQGFGQREGLDYNKTFAPVVKATSVRTFLSIAAILDLDLRHLDVKTAFLNGEIEEDIYMKQPPGYESQKGNGSLVCKLHKALYGLKQSPREWNKVLNRFIEELGFTRCASDQCMYVMRTSDNKLLMLNVHVDDMIIASSPGARKEVEDIVNAFKGRFKMSDLGELSFFLGWEVHRDREQKKLWISQRRYVEDILERFHMKDCKSSKTPLPPNIQLSKTPVSEAAQVAEDMRLTPYAEAVGSLIYLAMSTRPDLAFAVSLTSRFMSCPNGEHWNAVKHIFRYLRGTTNYRMCLGGSQVLLYGFSDSDFANDKESRRSVTGYVCKIGDGIVSWKSKKQQTIAQSTCEAEYMALSDAAKEVMWLRQLLCQLGFPQQAATILKGDNQGANVHAEDPKHHSRMKHIDVRYHYVREKYRLGHIKVEYVPTKENEADLLTKSLNPGPFLYLRNNMQIDVSKIMQSGGNVGTQEEMDVDKC